jgi:FKBP-type peptidyl-prolyl cis-trans isomerase 2
MNKRQTVDENKVVTMQYSHANSNGVVVREVGARPVTCLHGADVLFPKLNMKWKHTVSATL